MRCPRLVCRAKIHLSNVNPRDMWICHKCFRYFIIGKNQKPRKMTKKEYLTAKRSQFYPSELTCMYKNYNLGKIKYFYLVHYNMITLDRLTENPPK